MARMTMTLAFITSLGLAACLGEPTPPPAEVADAADLDDADVQAPPGDVAVGPDAGDARSDGGPVDVGALDAEPRDGAPGDAAAGDVGPGPDARPPEPDAALDPDFGADERCNGLDDDGDGDIDEGFRLHEGCDVGGVTGCRACAPDGRWMCETDAPDQCDGVDADCDGVIDEGPPCNGCSGIEAAGDPHLRPWMHIPDGWVCVPAGTYCMGSAPDEIGRQDREGQQRTVRISQPFLMRATETTQGEWLAAGDGPDCNPSVARDGLDPPDCGPGRLPLGPCAGDDADGADCPVNGITWYGAAWHADQASEAEGLSRCYQGLVGARCEGAPGQGYYCPPTVAGGGEPPRGEGPTCDGYRLPTEAEWEYATRAGAVGAYGSIGEEPDEPCARVPVGDAPGDPAGVVAIYSAAATLCPDPVTGTADDRDAEAALAPELCPRGWFVANSGCGLHRAGLLAPNRWGLHDMHGNLLEWVNDWRNGDPQVAEDERCGGGSAIVDPKGPVSGVPANFANFRTAETVMRGGGYNAPARVARAATIHATAHERGGATIGYRLVRTLVEPDDRVPCGDGDAPGFCLPRDAPMAAACDRLEDDGSCAARDGASACCVELPCRSDDGRSGTCRSREACGGVAVRVGLCPGNADVVCCIP